jgi:integrase
VFLQTGIRVSELAALRIEDIDFIQTPPDLVVKFQPIDIIAVILWLVLRLRIAYQWEIKG